MPAQNQNPTRELLKRIANRSAVIGIIGLGYVGLPLMLRFIEEKFRVIGFDVDKERVLNLNAGRSPIRHIAAKPSRSSAKGRWS